MKDVKEGAVWVCGACGKTADRREDFKDASCYLHGVECEASSLKYAKDGTVTSATATPTTPNKIKDI